MLKHVSAVFPCLELESYSSGAWPNPLSSPHACFLAGIKARSVSSDIVNSGIGRRPSEAAPVSEGKLSRHAVAVHRHLWHGYPHETAAAVVILRGPRLLDERTEDLPHSAQEDCLSITVHGAAIAGLESIKEDPVYQVFLPIGEVHVPLLFRVPLDLDNFMSVFLSS